MKNSGTHGNGGHSFNLGALVSGMRGFFTISASAPENRTPNANTDIREAYGDLAYGVFLSTRESPALIVGMWDGFRKSIGAPNDWEMFDVTSNMVAGRQFAKYVREEAPKLSTERRMAIIAENTVAWNETFQRFVPHHPEPAII